MPALRRSERHRIDIDLRQLRAPWLPLGDDGATFATELKREVTLGHVFHGWSAVRAIARREDRDDVLFVVDTMLAVVHLTYAGREDDPRWPYTDLFASWDEFLATRLAADVAELKGKTT